jgi:DNA-binding winged helix-turn-helix (wHTH) protein
VWQHNERATIRHHGNYDAGLTDTVLRGCIHTIRVALADTAATPQYLETVGRQEYRFRLGRVAGSAVSMLWLPDDLGHGGQSTQTRHRCRQTQPSVFTVEITIMVPSTHWRACFSFRRECSYDIQYA